MHTGHAELVSLLVLLAGSLAMPILSGRLRLPSAVLLLGYGVVIGPHALDLLPSRELLDFLAEVGFIVLMFLAGLEIDFNRIRAKGPRPLAIQLAICAATFGLAFAAAAGLGQPPLIGLALGATSVGLPLAVLREGGRLRTPLGQQILLLGSLGEFLTVVGMTLFYFLTRDGLSPALIWGLAKLLGLLLAAGALLRLLLAAAWWRPERVAALVARDDGAEIGVRAALLLAVGFAALAALAGVESIVGAFLAGALTAFVLRGKAVLEQKLSAVGYGLLVPIFFVAVGVGFDPAVIDGPHLAAAGTLVLATFAVRLPPALVLLRGGLGGRDLLALVALLSAPLTLVVAIAALGRELGLLDAAGHASLLLLAAGAGLIFPILFRVLARPPEA
jgi:Kef-type K+ transport system membrane component KefB